jgi:UDP-glucose 4-epimerase
MKYLVTGGAGFIGSHLSDALIKRGDNVTAFDNLSTGRAKNVEHLINENEFKLVTGSILDTNLLNDLVQSVDHVIHLAAAVGVFTIVNKPLESLVTNLRGTEKVLEAAERFGKEILIASSSEIYGKNSIVPLHEDSDRVVGSPLKSRWSYSEAKALDESMGYFYFQEKQLPVRLVRFFNTVGPRQVGSYGMVVPRFVGAALNNEPIIVHGTGSQSRCFCHVFDAVEGILKIIDSRATIGEVFNIGNSEEISIEGLAQKIIETLESKSTIKKIPYGQAYSKGFEDMQRRVPDIEKIKQVTGWYPKLSLNSIISDVAADLRG